MIEKELNNQNFKLHNNGKKNNNGKIKSKSTNSKKIDSKEIKIPVIPTLGKHIIVELSGCSEEEINDLNKVEEIMNQAAKKANATIIKSVFHKFSPMGVSGVVVISESHLSIHTWPELGYAAIDIYTCGFATKPFKACYFLAQKFKARKIKATYIIRGIKKHYNFYTHKIKMVEGNINTLKILPTLVKKIQNNTDSFQKENKNTLLLVGEKE
ncbi:MAG: adenosylmethionine decarboxylase [bacterium]